MPKDRASLLAYWRDRVFRIKQEVLSFYSNGTMSCRRCQYADLRALTIDHIDGGGVQRRKYESPAMAQWLKRQGFPQGYQVLCMNCQLIKRIENGENRWHSNYQPTYDEKKQTPPSSYQLRFE